MPVPSAISVNMLGRRFRIEAQPRAKSGAPAPSTATLASANCSQGSDAPLIVRIKTGRAKIAAIQKRRVISASSGLGAVAPRVGDIGSSAMPQSGQGPGLSLFTSGCIGQVQSPPLPSPARGGGLGGGAERVRYFIGSATNFVRQPAQQKKKSRPECAARCAVFIGSTVMPQTGSIAFSASATSPRLWTYTLQGYSNSVMRESVKKAAGARLARIEGQVRGIARMIEGDRYCIDVMNQIEAVKAALKKLEDEILKDHIAHCVEHSMASGDARDRRQKVAELVEILGRITS